MLTLLENEIIYGIKDITSHAKATGKPADLHNGLIKFFNDLAKDHDPKQILNSTESPALSKKLLEVLNPDRSKKIIKVGKAVEITGLDKKLLENYSIRHYTSSNPLDWTEKKVKSNLTLTVEKIFNRRPLLERRTPSGHTTFKDWCSIGNVGDTFYCLFYKNEPVTEASFLGSCTHYIEWSLDKFINCWTSIDWLDPTARQLQPLSGSILSILRFYFSNGTANIESAKGFFKIPKLFFGEYNNFEIKKHGSFAFTPDQVH